MTSNRTHVETYSIRKGHKLEMVNRSDDVIIRIDRPSGSGLPLYETIHLTDEEASALFRLLARVGY